VLYFEIYNSEGKVEQMPVIKGLEWTFNTVAEQYDKWSPDYVAELYEDLFAYAQIGAGSRALEIGIGTGQATRPVLDVGCEVLAVELGDRMAEICREKFREYPKFSVVNMPFQDFECPDQSFDLAYSARAFHWIPEEIGYEKVFDALKPGGVFARMYNHPYPAEGQDDMYDDMQKVYAKYMHNDRRSPAYLQDPSKKLTFAEKYGPPYSEADARRRSAIAEKYGFTDIDTKLYYRTRSYTAEEYVGLIGVYSDHIVMEKDVHRAFDEGICEAIEKHGGIFVLQDTVELNLARKPR